MSFSLRTVLVGAALLAWAPGCDSTIERRGTDEGARGSDDAEAGDDDGPGVPDRDAIQPGDRDDGDGSSSASSSSDDGSDDGGDGGDGGDGDDGAGAGDPGSAPSSLCPGSSFSGAAADAIGVGWSNDAATLLMRDGSLVSLDLPTEEAPADAYLSTNVVVGGDRVVVTRGWSTWEPATAHATVRWFDRQGHLLEELVSDDGLWAAFVADDGTTVMYRGLGDHTGYTARFADGSFLDFPHLDVWGEPLPSGWLRGYDDLTERITFVNIASGERKSIDSAFNPSWVDDGFVAIQPGEGDAPVLAHMTPEGTERKTLSSLAGIPAETLYLATLVDSDWAMVIEYPGDRTWRLDWRTGGIEPIAVDMPAGSEHMADQCGLAEPTLDEDGGVFDAIRTGGDGQLAIASIDGTWQPMGYPVAQPGSFSIAERAGTFVVMSGGSNDTYCPITGWDEPASEDALPIGVVQLVRPSAGVVRVLDEVDPWSIFTDDDGACVTFTTGQWDGTEIVRVVMDVATGEPLEVPGDSFVWIR